MKSEVISSEKFLRRWQNISVQTGCCRKKKGGEDGDRVPLFTSSCL